METRLIENPAAKDGFEAIGRVPIAVHAELDRKVMTLGELLQLREGDVIALPRAAGENINVYVGGALIGWGEVLLVEGAIAVRIADLRNTAPQSPEEHEADRRTH